MKKSLFLFLMLSIALLKAQQTLVLDEFGEKLRQFYLNQNVEKLWIAGQHINWKTGEPDNPDAEHNIKTHCSAFVAATCQKLKIYILRPPEHGQALLANAQFDWLQTGLAANQGWQHVNGYSRYKQAQDLANKGFVVVAVVKNPDEHKPGHIAFVMPAVITSKELAETGPRLIMAGIKNTSNISLKEGFIHHYSGWPENQIEFYYYANPVF